MKQVFKKPIFSWEQKELVHKSKVRDTYIKALQKADERDFKDVLDFSTH